MATTAEKSPVSREVHGLGFGEMIVTTRPDGLYIRQKGKRTTFGPLSWDFLFRRAAELAVQKNLEEKPRRRRRVSRGLLTTGR